MTVPSGRFVLTEGGGGRTVNPPVRVTTSAPVVTVTSRAPAVAAGSILITAVALTAEFTVTEPTVIPAPKLAVVVPWAKWVFCPISATGRFSVPCCAALGLICASTGVVVTVNAFARKSDSLGSKTLRLRGPAKAVVGMLITAVRLVDEFTVTDTTVIPEKKTEVDP